MLMLYVRLYCNNRGTVLKIPSSNLLTVLPLDLLHLVLQLTELLLLLIKISLFLVKTDLVPCLLK